uniref:Uncharacterized protein n=1 Tax=Poecilia mexicana TaxID=48701 RepID=A0A3B3XHX6_9TELE
FINTVTTTAVPDLRGAPPSVPTSTIVSVCVCSLSNSLSKTNSLYFPPPLLEITLSLKCSFFPILYS